MFKRTSLLLIFVLLLTLAFSVQAQEAKVPMIIDGAIDALATKVGKPLSLTDLNGYSWNAELYPDTSLGCPQAGQTYTQVSTSGVQFFLDYGPNTYEYHVSDDGKYVSFCQSYPVGQPPAGTTGTAPQAVGLCAEPLAFTVGQDIRVIASIGGLYLREKPDSVAKRVGRVTAKDTLKVVAGPECNAKNLQWWQVESGSLKGWISEGRRGVYFLEAAQ
ncbi:MAG TPA: SH3 domain-containing protein [Phototrophicaceae bacterium]|nr:SH3 domain-containing protein [Phototrophicaceae bacterium]